jgi:hypothetical protein
MELLGHGAVGELWATASPYFEVQKPLQTCTPCFHISSTSLPHPEFLDEMSMVCAMMAWYVLESCECGNSEQLSCLRTQVREIAKEQAD